jgi:hypothetical protein
MSGRFQAKFNPAGPVRNIPVDQFQGRFATTSGISCCDRHAGRRASKEAPDAQRKSTRLQHNRAGPVRGPAWPAGLLLGACSLLTQIPPGAPRIPGDPESPPESFGRLPGACARGSLGSPSFRNPGLPGTRANPNSTTSATTRPRWPGFRPSLCLRPTPTGQAQKRHRAKPSRRIARPRRAHFPVRAKNK